jgi:leucyl-tRNA synthetase
VSLSDSTIYSAYYTVAHYLHQEIYGSEQGLGAISVDQMTDEVVGYVFARADTVDSDIKPKTLQSMRREFTYWYPIDLRVSGKDLIQNHLTFFMYVHVVVWPKECWPRGIRPNGHLLLNSEKIAKSTGNFLMLRETVAKFGADAARIAIADAGDSIEDANFEEAFANKTILKLYELKKWLEEMILEPKLIDSPKQYAHLRDSHPGTSFDTTQRTGNFYFWDELFQNKLRYLGVETKNSYDRYVTLSDIYCDTVSTLLSTYYPFCFLHSLSMLLQLVLQSSFAFGFYDLTALRGFYREATRAPGCGMHHGLICHYAELQALLLAPIAPHWTEYIWRDVLGKATTVNTASVPEWVSVNTKQTATFNYIRNIISNIASAQAAQAKKLTKGKRTPFDPSKPYHLAIFYTTALSSWQSRCVDLLHNEITRTGDALTLEMKTVSQSVDKKYAKKAIPFVVEAKRRIAAGEPRAVVLSKEPPFDELTALHETVPILARSCQNSEKCLCCRWVRGSTTMRASQMPWSRLRRVLSHNLQRTISRIVKRVSG